MLHKKTTLFLWVLLGHLVILCLIVLVASPSRKQFYSSPITSVDLVEPVEISPEAAEAEEPVIEEPPPPEPEPEIETAPEPATEPPPKKIIKQVAPLRVPKTDLKKRLKERLAQVKSPAPGRPGQSSSVSASREDRFPYSWYNNFIQSKMYNLWKQPPKSAVKEETAPAIVSFRVYRDGHIENIRLQESSGSSIVDESTLQAARMADPLPPAPGLSGGI